MQPLQFNLIQVFYFQVNYVIIGVAIFYVHGDAEEGRDAEADRVALLAQGSYACMYLINALSTVLSSSENVSEVVGLSRRVSELLERLPDAEKVEETVRKKGALPRADLSSSRKATNVWPSLRIVNPSSARFGGESEYQPLSTLEEGGGVELTVSTADDAEYTTPPHTTYEAPSPGSDKTNISIITFDKLNVMCEGGHRDLPRSGDAAFGGRPVTPGRVLIRQLSLQVRWGMRVLVTGPSGCGKSTLLRLVAQAARAQAEGIDLDSILGVNFAVSPDLVVVCPQTPHLFQVR